MIPAVATNQIPAMSERAIGNVAILESFLRELPQVEIATDHVLHAGLYARTIRIPAGAVLTGVLIKIPTMLIFNGHATVNVGEGSVELVGYHVIAASAGRKQAYIAHADTDLTMIFATGARTVSEAEDEFTDDADSLFSRHGAPNTVTITGA